jgi:hypothetical protein
MEEVEEMSPQDEEESSKRPHKYDTILKDWVTQKASDILPLLIPGVEYERTVKSEIIRSVMRADVVFKVQYYGKDHILHLEFQSRFDEKLPSRLLVYNAVLHHDHKCPVITMVVYPFSVQVAVPPLIISSHEKDIVTFDFRTLPLFTMDAETCVAQHQIFMYPLVPTMHGVHADLMVQVVEELAAFYGDEKQTLSDQFTWMKVLLRRNDVISDLEKNRIEERLNMFDEIWEQSPLIQKERTEYYAKGRGEGKEEGIAQGELQTLQRTLVRFIQARFPELTEFAQRQAKLCTKLDVLENITQQLFTAPDRKTAQQLLTSISELQG